MNFIFHFHINGSWFHADYAIEYWKSGFALIACRYNSMQPVDGTTPIMPPFLLIRKATNTPFASQDSVEMPAIRSPTLPCRQMGISTE